MLIPPKKYQDAGWKITTVGDDIVWMWVQPEQGQGERGKGREEEGQSQLTENGRARLLPSRDIAGPGTTALQMSGPATPPPATPGKLRAINPEAGYFGVVPGTNWQTNP